MIRSGGRGRVRHFSMWPLMWQAACGATGVAVFTDLELVTCPDCRAVVARAEAAAAS